MSSPADKPPFPALTIQGTFNPLNQSRSAWVPAEIAVPPGRAPLAVRVFREGLPTVVIPLVTTRAYQLGRSDNSHLWFCDDRVSRQHGFLYFSGERSAWAYRDPGSTLGSYIGPSDGSGTKRRVPPSLPIGVVAGQTLELGETTNRLEFLADVPADALEPIAGSGWKSSASRELERAIQTASRISLPVFLLGESGTGKTYVAQEIHRRSGRKGAFVSINCGQLSDDPNHLRSELLGHVKGAFTGADKRLGKLSHADGGTLFLDEVESLPKGAQVFLLDLLEGGGDLTPLGASPGKPPPRPDFRFVSASKVTLESALFRKDLAQRLARGDIIALPGLEERREDVPVLVARFLKEISAELSIEAEATPEAVEFLTAQPWPGQIRELQTTVHTVTAKLIAGSGAEADGRRAIISVSDVREYLGRRKKAFGRSELDEEPATSRSTLKPAIEQPPAPRKRPEDLTREDVERALRASNGNKTHAAKALGIAIGTLKKKLARFGL